MYGNDASNKIGLKVPFSIFPQPTTCKSKNGFTTIIGNSIIFSFS